MYFKVKSLNDFLKIFNTNNIATTIKESDEDEAGEHCVQNGDKLEDADI